MVRGGKKEAEKNARAAAVNPEAEERKRRKRVAFSKGILSEAAAKASTAAVLSPSKTVTKHHGKDILRKSQRKNRFLFSFPGLLAPLSGGKIGELKDLGTKNPILYLHFSQVRPGFENLVSSGNTTFCITYLPTRQPRQHVV